ncbi:MAG: MG2 domain-containing protein, partial [Caldilineaceae bacterium]
MSGLGTHIQPGGDVAFLVQLTTAQSYEEAAGRSITVDLLPDGGEGERVFAGETDAGGLVAVSFTAPDVLDAREAHIVVTADGPSSTVTHGSVLRVGTAYDLLLTTDKPLYQPGQMLHMRALALERDALRPADSADVTFRVSDPQGNLLLQRDAATSSFGIAAMDFPLAAEAPVGFYELSATLAESVYRTSVEVKPYVLPRFEVLFEPAAEGYLPGQIVTGTVEAAYFFGKPVADAQVALRGFVTDVERVETVSLEGVTDADGRWAFSFAMPEHFVALPTEDETGNAGNRTASLDVVLAVTDTAGHTERTEETLSVAESPIRIELAAESGDLVAGTPNLLYIHTANIAGDGIATQVTLYGDTLTEPISATTDAAGLAVVEVPVPSVRQAVRFTAEAQAGEDRGARRQAFWVDPGLLLRTDRSEYQSGDTVMVDIQVPDVNPDGLMPEVVYLSVEKVGESKAVQPLPVSGGRAEAAIPLDGRTVGTLVIRAVTTGAFGALESDERYILVNVPEAEIEVSADAAEYRPGGTAILDVQVQSEGRPLPAALGVSIVDESVYALGESDPGFVRSYFLLAREMQEPRYGIEGFPTIEADDTSLYDLPPAFVAAARERALAGAFGQMLASGSDAAPVAGHTAAGTLWGYAARLSLALPLLGLAFYDGSQKRRRLLAIALVLALASGLFAACASPAAPAAPAGEAPASAAPAEGALGAADTTATRGNTPPARLRQLFPETLLWIPEVVTDANGAARIEVPIADSITEWRVSLVASDRNGRLGATTLGINVFQPFFVEPDLPTHFTAGDSVSIPVAIYNYLDAPQVVAVELAPVDGVELLGVSAQSVTLAANEV